MKIAVASEQEFVSGHFGHCSNFNIFTTEDGKIIAEENRGEEEEMILQTLTTEDEYKTYHIHIIKDGENIETICTMYGSNANLLAEYNDVSNIIPGEKLIIPSNDES